VTVRHISDTRREAECPTCGRPFDLTVICLDCGAAFTLTPLQQKFFIERGLKLPRRCESCRAERRHGARNPRAKQGPDTEVRSGRPQDSK
jgi:hypothetical protein